MNCRAQLSRARIDREHHRAAGVALSHAKCLKMKSTLPCKRGIATGSVGASGRHGAQRCRAHADFKSQWAWRPAAN